MPKRRGEKVLVSLLSRKTRALAFRRRHSSKNLSRLAGWSGFSWSGKSGAIRLAAPAYVWASIFISLNARASVDRFQSGW
jgi:hypothetical protein